MVEVVEKPSFRIEDFDRSKKRPGVSVIIRLKNEEDFLEAALASILPFFDEFIIVYNGCTDRTPEIVERFAAAEPKRVKAFHYVPEIFPIESEMYLKLPPDHVSSLVHYYNFALSKVSYRVCAKWDGDMIAAPAPFGRVMERLRSARASIVSRWTSPWAAGFWWYRGVNLIDKDGGTFVLKSMPRAGTKWDCGFWPVSRAHNFKHDPRYEILRTGGLIKSFAGFVFFHVKAMKKDRGTPYKKVGDWSSAAVLTFKEYCRLQPEARALPDPESLGIRPLTRSNGRAIAPRSP